MGQIEQLEQIEQLDSQLAIICSPGTLAVSGDFFFFFFFFGFHKLGGRLLLASSDATKHPTVCRSTKNYPI